MRRSSVVWGVIVATVMVVFGGCTQNKQQKSETILHGANNEVGTTQSAPKPFKIGLPFVTASTDPTIKSILLAVQTAVEAAGGELIVDNVEFTPDGTVNSIQKLISMGVNGVLMAPTADSIIPTINKMCVDAGVSFSIIYRSIKDPDVRALLAGSPAYAGNTFEDEEETAYMAISKMAELGVRKLCIIGVAKGDTTGDARDRGIEAAAKEMGIAILSESRGHTQVTDITKTVESFVAAYPELDGLFISASTVPGALSALMKVLEEHGLAGKVKVGRIDFDSTMGEYFAKGELNVIYGGHLQIDPLLNTAMLVNKVIGTPIAPKPSSIKIRLMALTSPEEALNYSKYVEGEVPVYTKEEIRGSFIKFFNPDVSEANFLKAGSEFSLIDVIVRHKDLVK